MWELDCEESWASKNWCFWTVVLEKTLESPLDCKEIQPVHSKGDQSWMFIGRSDAEAETPILWPPHAKSWLIWKDLDSGKGWGQYQKETTEDEMASPTQWTWVWVDSGSWWWTGRPSVLQFMGSQRVGHDWATELNWSPVYTDYVLIILDSQFSSVQFGCSVVSDSLRSHESQHARPPCPSLTPGVQSDSRPLS